MMLLQMGLIRITAPRAKDAGSIFEMDICIAGASHLVRCDELKNYTVHMNVSSLAGMIDVYKITIV